MASSSSAEPSATKDDTTEKVVALLGILPTLSYETAEQMLCDASWSVEEAVAGHFAPVWTPEPRHFGGSLVEQRARRQREEEEGQLLWDSAACWNPRVDEATVLRSLQTVETLIDSGADVDAIGGRNSSTPLHDACFAARPSIVRLLLERGANPNRTYKDVRSYVPNVIFDTNRNISISPDGAHYGRRDGDTPLHTVARASVHKLIFLSPTDYEETAKLLLKHGADAHLRTPQGELACDLMDLSEDAQLAVLQIEGGGELQAPSQALVDAAFDKRVAFDVGKELCEMVDFVARFHGEGPYYAPLVPPPLPHEVEDDLDSALAEWSGEEEEDELSGEEEEGELSGEEEEEDERGGEEDDVEEIEEDEGAGALRSEAWEGAEGASAPRSRKRSMETGVAEESRRTMPKRADDDRPVSADSFGSSSTSRSPALEAAAEACGKAQADATAGAPPATGEASDRASGEAPMPVSSKAAGKAPMAVDSKAEGKARLAVSDKAARKEPVRTPTGHDWTGTDDVSVTIVAATRRRRLAAIGMPFGYVRPRGYTHDPTPPCDRVLGADAVRQYADRSSNIHPRPADCFVYDPTEPRRAALLRLAVLLRKTCADAPPAASPAAAGSAEAVPDNESTAAEWTCTVCTLINAAQDRRCMACDSVRGRETVVLDD